MKTYLFIVILLFTITSYAQKKMTKSFSTESIKTINFNLDKVFSVTLATHKKPEVLIETNAEGENSEHIVLISKRLFGSLLISCELQPTFKDANDKLSAHKVISVELSVMVPENFSTYLKSEMANVMASGNYKSLTLELSNGSCKITDFTGNSLINTIKGDIAFQTNYATIEAVSKNGNVITDALISGENRVKLNSVNGDITVTKSEN